MTKSEAKAIDEAATRAIRHLENELWADMDDRDLAKKMYEQLKPALDEIRRIRDMATAELGGKR